MATIFSRIIAGEIPSYKVAENEDYYAFLDINPLTKAIRWSSPKRRWTTFSTSMTERWQA